MKKVLINISVPDSIANATRRLSEQIRQAKTSWRETRLCEKIIDAEAAAEQAKKFAAKAEARLNAFRRKLG